MTIEEIAMKRIIDELRKAEEKFPGWPIDILHGACIVAEESGEMIKAAIDYYYGRGDQEQLRIEIAQTGAMAIRFLLRMLDSKHYPKIDDFWETKNE